MYIPIILGTARKGRQSEKVANYILQQVLKTDIETEIIDVRDYRLEATDNTGEPEVAKKWKKIVVKADGFILVSPEYNHAYPGELKMMLDMLYAEYKRKPIGICGVSGGGLGGARAVEQLQVLLVGLGMVPLQGALYFSNVQDLFDEQGAIKDPSYDERVKKFLDELLWYANALKAAKGQ